jgi:hypothetical protein
MTQLEATVLLVLSLALGLCWTLDHGRFLPRETEKILWPDIMSCEDIMTVLNPSVFTCAAWTPTRQALLLAPITQNGTILTVK